MGSIRGSQVLATSSFVGVGSSALVQWGGGRTAVVIQANAYGTIALQTMGPGGAGIPVASAFVSNQVFTFDAVPGQYCLSNSASSTVGVNAVLVAIPYF